MGARCDVEKIKNKFYNKVVLGKTILLENEMSLMFKTKTQTPQDNLGWRKEITGFSYHDLFSRECQTQHLCTPKGSKLGDRGNNVLDRDIDKTVEHPSVEFGAQLKAPKKQATSARFFSVFRDGVERDLRLDIWFPDTKANARAGLAEHTIFVLWPDSTPKLKDKLSTLTLNKKPMFERGLTERVSGEQNHIGVSAIWASDEGKPTGIRPQWGYRLTVDSKTLEVLPARTAPKTYDIDKPLAMVCPWEPGHVRPKQGLIFNEPKYHGAFDRNEKDLPVSPYVWINFMKSSAN